MDEAKHTPGPWKARFEEAYYVTGPDLGRVAMMMNLKGAHGLGGRRSGEESAANCRLIAAAPDMLDALRDALRFVADQEDVSDGADGQQVPNRAMSLAQTLRAVIEKAGGVA